MDKARRTTLLINGASILEKCDEQILPALARIRTRSVITRSSDRSHDPALVRLPVLASGRLPLRDTHTAGIHYSREGVRSGPVFPAGGGQQRILPAGDGHRRRLLHLGDVHDALRMHDLSPLRHWTMCREWPGTGPGDSQRAEPDCGPERSRGPGHGIRVPLAGHQPRGNARRALRHQRGSVHALRDPGLEIRVCQREPPQVRSAMAPQTWPPYFPTRSPSRTLSCFAAPLWVFSITSLSSTTRIRKS